MLSIQHNLCMKLFNPNSSNREFAAVTYPDAIRAYTKAREYSHFEKSKDGRMASHFSFPKDMRADQAQVDLALNSSGYLVPNIQSCAIGELTDIDEFYEFNYHLEPTMYKGIEYHLKQDMVFDDFVRNKIDCSGKYDDKFIFKGQAMDGKAVRGLIGDIEQHGIYVLAHRLYEEQGITANQEWLQQNIKPAFDDEYNEELSEKTFSFMNIRDDINELITNHDWSKLDDGPLTRAEFEQLYDDVLAAMRENPEQPQHQKYMKTTVEKKAVDKPVIRRLPAMPSSVSNDGYEPEF